MANFPKHHGITLANNSWIENAHFERLAVDPVPVAAGRIWFNTTDKVFKFSTLDSSGAVIIRTQATAEDLATAISTINSSSTDIQTELDTTQTGAGLSATGTYVVNASANYIASATSLNDADVKLDAALKAEELARVADVSALQTELDTTQTGAGLSATGTYVANTSANYIASATSLNDADVKLDVALKSEETARSTAVSGLDSRVTTVETQVNGKIGDLVDLTTTDKTTIVAAINSVNSALATEVSRATTAEATESTARTTADTAINTRIDNLEQVVASGSSIRGAFDTVAGLDTLDEDDMLDGYMYGIRATSDVYVYATGLAAYDYQPTGWTGGFILFVNIADVTNAVAAEAALRVAADNTLTTDLASEVSRATTAETTIANNLATESTRAATEEQAIRTAVNNKHYSFTAGAAALVHDITHNLNTDMFLMNVMVEDSLGVYRNDIVPVEIVNANSIKIQLSVACKIKVSMLSMATI